MTDSKAADEDYAFQGEYVATIKLDGGETKVGTQIIALGDGKFQAVSYIGGLPGDGWDKSEPRKSEGTREGDTVTIKSDEATGTIKNDD